MARVFLDANILIDLIEKRGTISPDQLKPHNLFVSTLSAHILMYITKRKVPDSKIMETLNDLSLVDFNHSVCRKSLTGPTSDFEDNVQLHCASNVDSDLFLTGDKQILAMKFFGKTRILANLT